MSLFSNITTGNEKPPSLFEGTTTPSGQPANPNGRPTSLFGNAANSTGNAINPNERPTNIFADPAHSLFASTVNPNAQSTSLFGANLNGQSSSLFGGTTNSTGNAINPNERGSGLFGNAIYQNSSSTNTFHAPTNPNSPYLGTIFRNPNCGTLHTKFRCHVMKDGWFVHCISAMREYSDLSLEELRTIDYRLIKNPNTLPSGLQRTLETILQGLTQGLLSSTAERSEGFSLGQQYPADTLQNQNLFRPSIKPVPVTNVGLTEELFKTVAERSEGFSLGQQQPADTSQNHILIKPIPHPQNIPEAKVTENAKNDGPKEEEEEEESKESVPDAAIDKHKEDPPIVAVALTEEQQEALEKELAIKKQRELEEEQRTAHENQVRRRQNLQEQKTLHDQVLPARLFLSYNNFVLKEQRNFIVTYRAIAIQDRSQQVIVTALSLNPETTKNDAEYQRHRYELFLQITMQMLGFNHDLICPIIDYGFEVATTRAYFVQPMYSKSLRDMIDKGEKIDIRHLLTNLQSVHSYIESKGAVFGTLDPSTIYWHKGNYCLTEIYCWRDIFTSKKCLDMITSTNTRDPEDALAAEEEKLVNEENEFSSEIKDKMLLKNEQLRSIVAPGLRWSENTLALSKDHNEVYSEKEIENIQRQQVGLLILRVLGISNRMEKFLLESRVNATNYEIILGGVFLQLLKAKDMLYLLDPLASLLELDSGVQLSAGIQNILEKNVPEKTQNMAVKACKTSSEAFQIDSEKYCFTIEQKQGSFLAVCRTKSSASTIELWHNGKTCIPYLLQSTQTHKLYEKKYSMLLQIPESPYIWAYTGKGFDLVDIPQQKTLYCLDNSILQDIELDTVGVGRNHNIAMSKRRKLTVYNYTSDRYDTISETCDSFDLNHIGDKVVISTGSSLKLVETTSNKELQSRVFASGLFAYTKSNIVRWAKTIPVIAFAYNGTLELVDETSLQCLKKLPQYDLKFMSWSPFKDHLYTIQVSSKPAIFKFGNGYNCEESICSLSHTLGIQEALSGSTGKIKSISWTKNNELPLFMNENNKIFDSSIDSNLTRDAEILSCCYVELPMIPIN